VSENDFADAQATLVIAAFASTASHDVRDDRDRPLLGETSELNH